MVKISLKTSQGCHWISLNSRMVQCCHDQPCSMYDMWYHCLVISLNMMQCCHKRLVCDISLESCCVIEYRSAFQFCYHISVIFMGSRRVKGDKCVKCFMCNIYLWRGFFFVVLKLCFFLCFVSSLCGFWVNSCIILLSRTCPTLHLSLNITAIERKRLDRWSLCEAEGLV